MPLNTGRRVRVVAPLRAIRLRTALAAVLGASVAAGIPVAPGQAAPPACRGAAEITDLSGDGHHASSDVLAAWFSEQSGHLQAVVQVRAGTWVAEHGDAELTGSGFAALFSVGGQIHYVRAVAPATAPVAGGTSIVTAPPVPGSTDPVVGPAPANRPDGV